MQTLHEPAAGPIPFQVLAEIAVGATARVDLCRAAPPHPRQGQLLAVKRLHPHVAEDPAFVNQFIDEVRVTAALRHPNVVEVAGAGADEQGPYLAVELVQGVSLSRLMKTIFDTGEAFTERTVVYLGSRICAGLAAAHGLRAPTGELLNLVHRDLTPSNILVGFNGDVKITDFGTAKAKQRLTKTLTGMRKGDSTYMAPEQARADVFDARADLFSFGVMMFELLAGRRPWTAKGDLAMIQAIANEPPADLAELRPRIDREIVNVVLRCLEKDPDARFQSAREVADRFDLWLSVHGYQRDNEEALGRFVRRNAMRQMRWFERAIVGELTPERLGRERPPRVPTFTDGFERPDDIEPEADAPRRVAIPAPRPGGKSAVPPVPSKPLVPPRAPTVPDPRSLRAAQAVEQLKRLAPPPEPPRPRSRGLDDDDRTDVELRLGSAPHAPRIFELEDDDAVEEIPTLVKTSDAKVKAMQADARQAEARGLDDKPPYVAPGLIVDEDSDQRVTAVKAEQQHGPGPHVISIVDPETGDLPTAPRQSQQARDLARRGAPNLRPPVLDTAASGTAAKHDGGVQRLPGKQVIPPSPVIPRLAFPSPDSPSKPTAVVKPPPSGRDSPLLDPTASPAATDSARVSNHDDVEVIDREALRKDALLTEDGILAEADRLAIEAVRCAEEARSAQLRAERKAAAAKTAAEAARIAADAVRLVRSAGVFAAAKRLEEAHAVERTAHAAKMTSGPLDLLTASLSTSTGAREAPPAGVTTSLPTPSRSSPTFEGAVRGGGAPLAPPAPSFPGVDAARAQAIAGIPPPARGSMPPPPLSFTPLQTFPSFPSQPSSPAPHVPDMDPLPQMAKPTIFGLPPTLVVALAVLAVFLVIFIALLLAR